MSGAPRIALLGFGEVGQKLAADLRAYGHRDIAAWDVLFTQAGSGPSGAAVGLVRAGRDCRDALAGSSVVICAVTAAQCVAAAEDAARTIAPGTFFVDLNSVAPSTKVDAAAFLRAAGARYVEAPVMSPIGPKGIASPILLGGPHAGEFLSVAHALGFSGTRVFSAKLGQASAAKLCRSVMIKGLEALLAESMLAARRYGVETAVLDSLRDLLPGTDWPQLARYMISRSLLHGHRRAEEMREAARTVSDAGVEPLMSSATAQRQDWAAAYAAAAAIETLAPMLDAVLNSSGDSQC